MLHRFHLATAFAFMWPAIAPAQLIRCTVDSPERRGEPGCTIAGGQAPSLMGSDQELMRIALNVAGVVCLLVGCVWVLQGINVLPGSFMTGQIAWAIYGGFLLIVGVGLLAWARRRRGAS